MKYLLVIAFLNVLTVGFAQENLITFNNDLKTSSSDIKDVIPIVDEKTGSIAFFVADAKNVYGYKIDSTFKVTHKISSEEKRRKFKILIGSSISDNNSYRVFLTTKNQDKFFSIQFSFEDGTTSTKEFELNNNEKFIQTVNYNNAFYLISASKLTNGLYIHTFDEEGNPKRNTINFSSTRFINKKGKNTNLVNLLIGGDHIKKFEENTPNSIELTSEERKMYLRGNKILFTFDHHKTFTQILEIDLSTFNVDSFQFKKPNIGTKAKRSNSYINDNYVFTIAASNEKFLMEVLDFKTGNLIKNYTGYKNDSITFKNTPIIQEGGMYDNYRELGKTKRFLKRIVKGNTGISARKVGNLFHVVMGGYIVQKMNGGMMMPFGGLPIASIGSVTVFFNPTMLAYNSFENNKATRIESLFDENFNHVKGEIKENAFDKMRNFSSNNKGTTIFKYKGFFIKTQYKSFIKDFRFRKFTD